MRFLSSLTYAVVMALLIGILMVLSWLEEVPNNVHLNIATVLLCLGSVIFYIDDSLPRSTRWFRQVGFSVTGFGTGQLFSVLELTDVKIPTDVRVLIYVIFATMIISFILAMTIVAKGIRHGTSN